MGLSEVAEVMEDVEEAFNAAAVQTALVRPSPPTLRFSVLTSPLRSSKWTDVLARRHAKVLVFPSCQWLAGCQKEPAGVQWLTELPQRSTGRGYYEDREADHKDSRRKVNQRPLAHPLSVQRTKLTSLGLQLEVDSLRCLLGHPLIDKGHTATVFGATGFLGRYIVNRLGMPHIL